MDVPRQLKDQGQGVSHAHDDGWVRGARSLVEASVQLDDVLVHVSRLPKDGSELLLKALLGVHTHITPGRTFAQCQG